MPVIKQSPQAQPATVKELVAALEAIQQAKSRGAELLARGRRDYPTVIHHTGGVKNRLAARILALTLEEHSTKNT